jgi:Cyclic nucleotide-binding domain/Major Facilitator Superfamily
VQGLGVRAGGRSTRSGGLRLDIALGIAALANRAYSIALVVYVYNATHSSAWVAAAAVARYLPGVFTSVLAQPVLDRFAPRALMVWSDVLCGLSLALMATAIALTSPVWIPIVLAGVVRIAASGQPLAAARLLPIVAGGRDLSQVAGRQAATDKLLLLLGPAIGGLLLLVVSPAVELYLLAGLAFVAAIISAGLPAPAHLAPTAGRRSTRAQIRALNIWPDMRTHTTEAVGIFIALAALSGFVYGTDTVLLAVIATNRLHLGDAGYGAMFAGLGAGGLLVAPLVNRLVRRHRLAGLLGLSMTVYCLPTVAVAHLHHAFPVVVLEAVRGAGALAVDVIALTELQRIVLPSGLPTLTARLTSVVFAAVAAGALMTPLFMNWFGTTNTLVLLGLIPPALVWASYPRLRRCDTAMSARLAELGPRIAVLEQLGLLQASSRPVLERLANDMTEVEVPGATVVIEQDATADAFYVVKSGHLDVFVGDRQVNLLQARDWFGEIGLLEGLPRTATVKTRGACTLYRIGGETFLEAFAQLPPSPSLLDSVAARLATGHVDDEELTSAVA